MIALLAEKPEISIPDTASYAELQKFISLEW